MEINISLRLIDKNNWRECIKLKVKPEQEKFVGSNENSLALAYVYREMKPRGIYLDEKIIGFIMYALDSDDNIYYINRFMIDENYQGNGYGRKALEILIQQLKIEKVKTLDIIHKPDNHSAIKIYKSLGFEFTDEKLGDDIISRLNISAN